ncbi:MAG: hypothetical protein GTN99_11450, partial [Candidatus Dadabacteria bacterium]|nr:hypothetical protein [Candidatus Dadabacteria bacterium]
MEYPKLRYVDTFPLEHEGARYVCIRDPQNTNGSILLVPPPALYIIAHFTGSNSLVDIQANILKQHGELIEKEHILMLVKQLDDALLLDSEKYRSHQIQIENEFRDSEIREASHAGLSYPSNSSQLTRWIDGYFANASKKSGNGNRTVGIISP